MVSHAETLRREFDESFATLARATDTEVEALLAIRIGDSPYALRVLELGGTAAGQRITPVPSPERALLGLAAIRGAIVPVFDLAVVLEEPGARGPLRWLALSSGQDPVAFAFAELEGHLKVKTSELGQIENTSERLIANVVRTHSGLRPVLRIEALVDAVRGAANQERRGKVG